MQTGFFRDPALFRAIRTEVAPLLRTYPTARVWLPSCGSGEDAISTAIVLREERVPRVSIYATDSDAALLTRAGSGQVPAEELSDERYRASGGRGSLAEYFAVQGPRATVRPVLLGMILFAEHDVRTDGSINEFQLVVEGPRLSALAAEERARALRTVNASLCRLGWLALEAPDGAAWLPDAASYAPAAAPQLCRKVR